MGFIDVSVVIPTFRRPDLLGRCLDAIAGQTLNRARFEVIVVDDEGSKLTRQLVDSRSFQYARTEKNSGPAAARNVGWKIAQGDIIAFTDDDTVPDRDWLISGFSAVTSEVIAVWGKVVVPVPDRPRDYEREQARLSQAGFVTANCFCRKAALIEIGGFDEKYRLAWREDSALYFDLLKLEESKGGTGRKVVYNAAAIVVHPIKPVPWGDSVRSQKKAMYNALLYKKSGRLYRQHIQKLPPVLYYLVVISASLSVCWASLGHKDAAKMTGVLCTSLFAFFFGKRVRGLNKSISHMFEMVVTSLVIPFMSIFWRLRGAVKYKVLFL
ncbi:MAG: glycosyltransferase family 2 protein [Oligoflexales bacterium]